MQRLFSFVVRPDLASYFLCSNSTFHLLVPARAAVLLLFIRPTSKDRKSQYIVSGYFSHSSPVDRAREVFEPSTDWARLLVPSENNFSVLGLRFSGRDVTSGGCCCVFLANFTRPLGANPMSQFFGSSFLETRLSSEF